MLFRSAAHRGGITTIIIPAENEPDLKEIPDDIKADLSIKPVKWIDEVLEIALEQLPKPISDEEYLAGLSQKKLDADVTDGQGSTRFSAH